MGHLAAMRQYAGAAPPTPGGRGFYSASPAAPPHQVPAPQAVRTPGGSSAPLYVPSSARDVPSKPAYTAPRHMARGGGPAQYAAQYAMEDSMAYQEDRDPINGVYAFKQFPYYPASKTCPLVFQVSGSTIASGAGAFEPIRVFIPIEQFTKWGVIRVNDLLPTGVTMDDFKEDENLKGLMIKGFEITNPQNWRFDRILVDNAASNVHGPLWIKCVKQDFMNLVMCSDGQRRLCAVGAGKDSARPEPPKQIHHPLKLAIVGLANDPANLIDADEVQVAMPTFAYGPDQIETTRITSRGILKCSVYAAYTESKKAERLREIMDGAAIVAGGEFIDIDAGSVMDGKSWARRRLFEGAPCHGLNAHLVFDIEPPPCNKQRGCDVTGTNWECKQCHADAYETAGSRITFHAKITLMMRIGFRCILEQPRTIDLQHFIPM